MENKNLPPELRNDVDSRQPESSPDPHHERSPLDTLTENVGAGHINDGASPAAQSDETASPEPTYTIFSSKPANSHDSCAHDPGSFGDVSNAYHASESPNTDFILIGDPHTPEKETETSYDLSDHKRETEASYNYSDYQRYDQSLCDFAAETHYKNEDQGFHDFAGAVHRNINNAGGEATGRAAGGISKKFFIVSLVFAMIVTSAVTTFGIIFCYNHFSEGSDHATNYTLSKESNSLSYDSIVHKVNSSVVSIVTESVSTDNWAQNYVKKGAGSGVIIQKNGYILTCNHVIQNASKIRVNMSNDKSYPAKLIASSPDDDLAVLKISASGLNAATYGDSSKLEVGDNVIAIGNPLGQLSNTASTGIISALNRQLTIENRKLNLLQTDASINPGNSGGALFNGSGNLIGIVVAKSAGSDVEGLGFAIPINHAAQIAKKLIKNGDIKSKLDTSRQGALIGVTIQDLGREQAQSEGFDDGGVFIISVTSPYAQKAGLQSRDRIHSLDGKTIKDSVALRKALAKHKAGDKVDIIVVRGKKKISAKVTLISASQTTQ